MGRICGAPVEILRDDKSRESTGKEESQRKRDARVFGKGEIQESRRFE